MPTRRNRYGHLLSPVKFRNTVFKNRLISTNSLPHFLQGPEPYPSEAIITHLANRAKNGAAIVTVSGISARIGLPEMPPPPGHRDYGDIPHFPRFNLYDPKCQNYFAQLVDAVHYYGAKASMSFAFLIVPGYDVCEVPERNLKAYTPEMLDKMLDDFVEQAAICKSLGFDMGSIHMAYRLLFPARFLSPLTNHRTDEFGGSLENRAKIPLELFRRIKEKVGQDFLLEAVMSAEEEPGGYTFEEACEFLKMAEGLIDIVQVRMPNANDSHPTGFMKEATPTLKYAEGFKKLGLNMIIAPVGGFQDLDEAEEAIASGKADMIAAARAWICDFDYGRKMAEGRGEDVVPCIRCNKCHVIAKDYPYLSACSVNPAFGIEHMLHRFVAPPRQAKKIAIIGGGPAGMEAALIANERGHRVVIFEKNGSLGGMLIPGSQPDFKWPLKKFKDYLVKQVKKAGIEVRLNTFATPEMIEREEFDVVIGAVGTEPILPPIEGIENKNVLTAIEVLNNPLLVSGKVVVVGGGEVGVETGLYLAKTGHETMVLEMTAVLAKEALRPHYYEVLELEMEKTEGFKAITNAQVTRISPDSVTYVDAEGKQQIVPADTVVIAVGVKPLFDLALSFYDSAKEFYMIGDCHQPGSLMTALRSAFAVASNI
ncbi:FAD-dependent oxidoreductase [Moorellaceae bacterium AZ2]